MNSTEKKYCVSYDDLKAIKTVVFNQSSVLYTHFNMFDTNKYEDLVDFIYNNNLYANKESYIDYSQLSEVEPTIKETLFKYDD